MASRDGGHTAFLFLTLHGPEDAEAGEDSAETESTETLRVEAEGGYYFPITENGTGEEHIGQKFENPVFSWDGNSTDAQRIGTNQGFGFDFPIIDDGIIFYNGNRRFLMREGSMDVFNEVVVRATGKYKKYTGTLLSERVVSPDPSWVSEVTLSNAAASEHGAQASPASSDATDGYDFAITSENGFYAPVTDPNTGEQIGERFQNPVTDRGGDRVGTAQGYGFDFPADPSGFARPVARGNRAFYLGGGELDVFNEVVVRASGGYSEYTGGRASREHCFDQSRLRLGDNPAGTRHWRRTRCSASCSFARERWYRRG